MTFRHQRREGGGGGGNSLFTKVIDKHVYNYAFFYTQPSPKQGTTLNIIIHVFIFCATAHRYTPGVNDV